jgi:hypothetical protein
LKLKTFGTAKTTQEDPVFAHREAKGPNPLSCKKKQKIRSGSQDNQSSTTSKKRKRKRLKLPEHVKQELFLANKLKS